jgi:hypothetical protein
MSQEIIMDSDEYEDERAGTLYAAYYKWCPDLVDIFEEGPKKQPWTNFYNAIEQCDIDMYALCDALLKCGTWPEWHMSGGPRSTEITVRFLWALEETTGICMIESYISWYMSWLFCGSIT